jgi:hypothetical protein
MQIRELREPAPTTNDRTAFYNVTDVMQSLGIRDRQFDSIVLHCAADTGKFQKYAVFLAPKPNKTPNPPPHTHALFVYYDAAKSKFWSDGLYRAYAFDPTSAASAVKAHVANEQFMFYTVLQNVQQDT